MIPATRSKQRMNKTVKTPGTPPFPTNKRQSANTLELRETYRTLTYINMVNTGIPKPPDQTGRVGPANQTKHREERDKQKGHMHQNTKRKEKHAVITDSRTPTGPPNISRPSVYVTD